MSATPSSPTPSMSALELAALMAIVGGTAAVGRDLVYPTLPVARLKKYDPTYSPLVGMANVAGTKKKKEDKQASFGSKVIGAGAGLYGGFTLADWLLELNREKERKKLLDKAVQEHETAMQEYVQQSNGTKVADTILVQAQQLQKFAARAGDILADSIDVLTSIPLIMGATGAFAGGLGIHLYNKKALPDPVKEFVARRQLSEARKMPVLLPTELVPSVDEFDNEEQTKSGSFQNAVGQGALALGAGTAPKEVGQKLGQDPEMQEFVKSKLNPADIAVGTKEGIKGRVGNMFSNVTSMLGI